jgi:hypothetical protein
VTIFLLLFLLGRSSGYPWGRRRVGPRAGMDSVEKREVSYPCRQSNPDSSATQPVAIEMNGCAGLSTAGCARTSREHSVELCRSSYLPHMPRHGSGGQSLLVVFQPSSGHVGFVVYKVALRLLRVLRFPCQFSFHRLLRYNRPNSVRRTKWTQSHPS